MRHGMEAGRGMAEKGRVHEGKGGLRDCVCVCDGEGEGRDESSRSVLCICAVRGAFFPPSRLCRCCAPQCAALLFLLVFWLIA